jgi:hypothetical protein
VWKFLVIDEGILISALRRMLLEVADQVVLSSHLDDAREQIAQNQFTYIFCGGELPKVPGGPALIKNTEEFLQEVFAKGEPRPVVYCTATHPDNRDRMQALGCKMEITDKLQVPTLIQVLINNERMGPLNT